jgi:hypothetical protein
MSNVCLRPSSSSIDHLTVPFSVTIMLPATPLTLLEIFVVGPTKSSLLVVIHAEQQLSIIRGTLSESKGADAGKVAPVFAARHKFCLLAMVAKANRLSFPVKGSFRSGKLARFFRNRWLFEE